LKEGSEPDSVDRTLDRAKWYQPLCTIIITHNNYSHLIEDALLSVLDQSYENWECVVVDDFSTEDERRHLGAIVERLSEPRIRLIQNTRQIGQIETFFGGLAKTTGEFVSPLDPDDRLASTYLEKMVRAHLNETVFCPVVICEQKLFRPNDGLVTGTWKGRLQALSGSDPLRINLTEMGGASLVYFSWKQRYWPWTSTTGIMIRRSALNIMTPYKALGPKSGLAGYLAHGAHFLGGTLFFSEPLVYRGVHESNVWLTEDVFSMQQNLRRAGGETIGSQRKRDVLEAMFHNGVTRWFAEEHLVDVLRVHFDEDEIALVGKTCPEAYRLWRRWGQSRSFARRIVRRVCRLTH
jgi:glycosyltransferase involved in cell wall biosynthesis